jgi:hypothetical protein
LDDGHEDEVVKRLRAHLDANQTKRKPTSQGKLN